MARFTIYSKDGQIKRHEGEPQYSGSYMGVDFVEFRTISSPAPIDWQIGDYVDYYRTGKRYRLYSLPMPKKVARKGEYGASFEYSNVQLYGATKELEIAPFRDLVPKDNKIHFSTRPDVSTYENVYGIARRIQECMDDLYPNKWRIEVYDTDDTDLLSLFEETKEYSVSGGSCLDALSQIYETWKNVGWIHTYDSANKVDVITIGRANVRNADNTSDSFAYGVGKGLTSIKKASANKDEFATRLYIYGSERNIQTRYYNGLDILNKDSVDIRNLMLPIEKWGKTNGLPDASKAYLQADDSIIEKYGLIPRTVYFDGSQNEEIYPSIVGLTERRVRQAMINAGQSSSPNLPPDRDVRLDVVASVDFTKDSGDKTAVESNPTFKLYYGHLGFNLADQGRLTSEGYAVISMKSGACAGREFVVQSSEDTGDGYGLLFQIAVVKRTWDESLGMGFPNEIYPIKNGDEFVILDIPMPDYYITLAADDLLSAGEKMLADYTRVSAFYEPSVDAIKIKEGGKLLQAGMFMQVYDEDIIDTADKKDYVLIDTLTIDEKSDLPIYRVTLREQKRSARTYSALEDMIEDARETNKQEINRVKQYTDRRFRSAQETLDMLAGVFENFTDGISPATVRTMSMLVGDESLQFKFTAASNSLADIECPFSYDETTKQMKSMVSYLKHMTLGIKTITTGAMSASSYETWRIPAWASAVLDDGAKSYYVYVKASKTNSTSECLLSETPIGMEDVSGHYHFLVGILNSEVNGKRDFVTLYGFTEVLPGQITTDIIRSGNGNLIIDLTNAEIEAKDGATISGRIVIGNGSSGLGNFDDYDDFRQGIVDEVSDILSDGVVSPLELQALEIELARVESEKVELQERCDNYGLGTLYNYTFYQQVTAYITALQNVIEDQSSANIQALKTALAAYKTARESILIAIANTEYNAIEAAKDAAEGAKAEAEDVKNQLESIGDEILESLQDDILTESEKAVLKQYLDTLSVEEEEMNAAYTSVYDNSLLPQANRNSLKSAYDNLSSTIASLKYIVQNIIDGVEGVDYDDYKGAFNSYKTAYEGYVEALEAARKAIEEAIEQKADDANTNANAAKDAADAAKEVTDNLNNDNVLTELEKREIRRLISEITECKGASVKTYSATVTRTAKTGYPWYLVDKDSFAEYYNDEYEPDQEGYYNKVSQKDWQGYYSSNMHDNNESTTTHLNITVVAPFDLKLRFGSDAEGDYDYLIVGALDKGVVITDETNNLSDATKQANTKGKQGIYNVQTKTFAIDASKSHYIELAYKKDNSAFHNTDSGYYRLLNDSWVDGDSEYIMELRGSFHRYYLTLMRNGLETEANELNRRLNAVMYYLNTYALWTSGDTTVPNSENEKFRDKLNSLLVDYFSYAAEIGFDISINRLNDMQYLSNAMKNGQTVVDGGLVLSSMVAVGDTENLNTADVEAFLNGSDFAEDNSHGKLLLALGIPENVVIDEEVSTDLEDRAKEAKTRIYEDGRVDTNDIHATGGTFENVTVSGIFKNPFDDDGTFVSKSDNYVNLNSSSITAITLPTDIEQSGRKVTFVGYFIITCSTNIIVEGKETNFYEISNEITELVAVKVSASQVQWHVLRRMPYGLNECSTVRHSGMFAGLRPKIRVVTSSSTNEERQLTELDHTIIVNDWTGYAVYLHLPSNPQEGQKFDIYTTNGGTNLDVYFNHNKTAYNFITGNDLSSPISFTDGKRKHIEFFFCGQWWLNYRFLD